MHIDIKFQKNENPILKSKNSILEKEEFIFGNVAFKATFPTKWKQHFQKWILPFPKMKGKKVAFIFPLPVCTKTSHAH